MGAWIETPVQPLGGDVDGVAPYVGAWIETMALGDYALKRKSHPMWVRGLKHIQYNETNTINTSHPMWVRGLKLVQTKKH